MSLLIFGLVLFLGVHSVAIVSPTLRARALHQLGERAWKGSYALVSLVGFVLICYGFGLARQAPVIVYSPPTWASHVALIVMLVALFPANIRAAREGLTLRGRPATQLWLRAPMQILFIGLL